MKVVFLDIDGPMKPVRSYFSRERGFNTSGGFDPLSVDAINRLCEKTGAKIVTNTTWNKLKDIPAILVAEGIKKEHIHEDHKTFYPDLGDRLLACKEWMARNPGVKHWCAIDDVAQESENWVLIDAEVGITGRDYTAAAALLGVKDPFIVLL